MPIQRLYETIDYLSECLTPISTAVDLKEAFASVGGTPLKVYGAYEVKVWNTEAETLNHRSYKLVIPSVLQEQKTTIGFVNHPKDGEEDPARIFSVQKNPHMKEGWLAVDLYLVGDYGLLAESVLKAGGPLTISSSALGEVDKNSFVSPNNFKLERYADWVWNPANGLEQYFEDIKKSSSAPADPNAIKESLTITNNRGEDKTMSDKALETALRFNIKATLKEAVAEPKLREKKAILLSAQEAAAMLTDHSLYESISKDINDLDEQIYSYAQAHSDALAKPIEESKPEVDTSALNESIASLQLEKDTLQEQLTSIKAENAITCQLYEEKFLKEAALTEELATATDMNQKLVVTNTVMKERIDLLVSQVTDLAEKNALAEATSNTLVTADSYMSLHEEHELLKAELAKVQKELQVKITESTQKVIPPTPVAPPKAKTPAEKVKEYFEGVAAKDASLKEKEQDFLACGSLEEAQLLLIKLQDQKKAPVITEQVTVQSPTAIVPVAPKVKRPSSMGAYLKARGYK